MNWNDEKIRATASELRSQGRACRVTDLIALAPQNDPFYVGSEGEREKAHWFADLWHRFGYRRGVHLRRVHYQLVSQDPLVLKPDGTPYENTERDWDYLGTASKCARYLGLVYPGAFVHRCDPAPVLNAEYWEDPTPDYSVSGFRYGLNLPELQASNYGGPLQLYDLEIWVEKTTMNDVLEPLCERYNVNLVTGAGEISITAALDLVGRAEGADRPCRIFYVSDFDPAGYGMPVSVARKVERFVREYGLDLDIRLEPIALTRQQVIEYRLPRQPIRKSERHKGAFEDVHGQGTVELDALEALHPGALEDVVRAAILTYYDEKIEREASEQRGRLQSALDKAGQTALADLQPQIEVLKQQVETLQRCHTEIVEAVQVDLSAYPLPVANLVHDGNDVLYDSTRDYLSQLEYYKARQEG